MWEGVLAFAMDTHPSTPRSIDADSADLRAELLLGRTRGRFANATRQEGQGRVRFFFLFACGADTVRAALGVTT